MGLESSRMAGQPLPAAKGVIYFWLSSPQREVGFAETLARKGRMLHVAFLRKHISALSRG